MNTAPTLKLASSVLARFLPVVLILTILTLASASTPTASASGSTIIVNDLGDAATAGDGKCTLREAINNANSNSDTTSGDCVAGSGTDTINFNLSGTIVLTSTLPAISDSVTIDGSGQSITISGNSSVRVLSVNSGVTLNLNSLTISNGQCSCTGAGISSSGALNVSNSVFSSNSATQGGAIWITVGNLSISNTSFISNTTSGTDFSGGGAGIYRQTNGTTDVANAIFSNNTSTSSVGAGIYLRSGNGMAVTASTFSSNSAKYGGGIFAGGPTVTVSGSTFISNTASTQSGGGIYSGGSTPMTVSNSTFSGNSAAIAGGGIALNLSDILINSTFSGNSNGFSSGGGSVVKNTLLVSSGGGGDCTIGYGLDGASIGNMADDSSCGSSFTQKTTGQINLQSLANNGGSTKTMALLASSAARDAGNSATCLASPINNLDQRGVTRTSGNDSICDIGAFEYDATQAGPIFTVGTTDDHDDGACTIIDCTLREAISAANARGGSNTINFAVNGTITLASLLPNPTNTVTIDGSNYTVSVNGNNNYRVFVVNSGVTLNLNNLTITQGVAFYGGGIVVSGTLNVSNTTFTLNNALYSGGAIYNPTGTLNVSNSTFNADIGGTGAAIYSTGAQTVINSTFSGNWATSNGAIFVNGPATLKNILIANAIAGTNCVISGTVSLSSTRNMSDDSSCGSSFIQQTSGQINLQPLANNGGSTQTMALGSPSTAIDAGDNATCSAAPINNLDQRGDNRIINSTDPTCDIGAFEYDGPQAGPNFTVNMLGDYAGTCALRDCTLREAIAAANAHAGIDSVNFVVNGTISLGSSLPAITDSVAIDGSGHSVSVNGNSAVQILTVNSNISATLNNLTLTNGKCISCSGGAILNNGGLTLIGITMTNNTTTGSGDGGAIKSIGALTLTNSVFSRNSSNGNGGAIHSTAALTLTNSTFSNNSSNGDGGAINSSGALTLTNATVSNNSSPGNGGGINSSGNLAVTSSNVYSNSATNNGGGINSSGALIVTATTFDGNHINTPPVVSCFSATQPQGGGGINNMAGAVTVTNSIFKNGVSGIDSDALLGGSGVGINNQGGTVLVQNSTFSNNFMYAGCASGTAVYNTGILTLTNSTFYSNSAKYSGGIPSGSIFNYSPGYVTITNSTFVGNQLRAGGINNYNGTATVKNSIIVSSSSTNCSGTFSVTSTHNMADDGSCGGSFSVVSLPQLALGGLANNGGPTQTIALLAGSAAIDAGSDASCPSTDQRGYHRPIGAHCDIGAFEAFLNLFLPLVVK